MISCQFPVSARKGLNSIEMRGFTLIEVLCALSIIVVAIMAVGGSFNLATNLSAFSQSKSAAVQDAEKTMEQARRLADSAGLTGAGSVSDSGTWSTWITAQAFANLPQESVAVTFPAGTGSNPLQVKVVVTWSEKGVPRSYELQTLVTPRT